jgi:predicted DCC family thiol-disulfide oxidoreductase YuxK
MSPRPRFTGGQYSLCRILLGGSLAFWALGRLVLAVTGPGFLGLRQAASCLVIGISALLFAAGWHDRVAAVLMLASLASLCLSDELPGSPALLVAVFWLLLAHLFVPPAPYGSLAARGRPDPDGGWRLPTAIRVGTFTVLVTIAAAEVLVPRSSDGAGVGAAWAAGALLLLFAANPGWIRGRSAGAPETLFYDGTCGLCHRAVRFLLAEDPGDGRFRFAPLQGGHFRTAIAEAQRRDLPDSLVLLARDGRVLTRWRAVRHGLIALGGYWAILGWIGALVPPALGDAAYDLVARVRHRLFARPPDACPITPAHLRARFILD